MNSPITVVPAKTRIPRLVALERKRLSAKLEEVWKYPVTTVTGPAGSGKTTLLAQFATSEGNAGTSVAWYQAEPSDGTVTNLLRHLDFTLRAASSGVGPSFQSVDQAAAQLDRWIRRPTLLVIDDMHALEDTAADQALEALINYCPPDLHVVLASRRIARWNLSRLRVSGMLYEITPDDLRFRSWEVEQLFCQHFQEPLKPREMAELARRTEGWAAGLTMFHLATRERPLSDRRRLLESLATRPKLMREYLTRNVLDGLPNDLREFLVTTCVLGQVTTALCDQITDRRDSDMVIAELERRHIFISSRDGGTTWRYHEVLRSHLEELLVGQLGRDEAGALYRKAARLLDDAGAWTDALRAHVRAEDLSGATPLPWRRGKRLIERAESWADAWIENVPAAIANHDPWILLALARRQAVTGRWRTAMHTYERAEFAFGAEPAAGVCRRELRHVASWLDPRLPPDASTSVIRNALARDPVDALISVGTMAEPLASLIGGIVAALAGRFEEAAWRMSEAAAAGTSVIGDVATILASLCQRAAGHSGAMPGLDMCVEDLESRWLPGLARTVHSLTAGDTNAARSILASVTDEWNVDENPWLEGLRTLVLGGLALSDTETKDSDLLQQAALTFERLGAGVLQAWATALGAMARAHQKGADDKGTVDAVRGALSLASSVRCPGAMALGHHILAQLCPSERSEHRQAASELESTGVSPLGPFVSSLIRHSEGPTEKPAAVVLRCFGPFRLTIGITPIDCSTVRPQCRVALRRLAVDAGNLVHRETLMGVLWPDEDPHSATRRLHVTMSSVRQLLQAHGHRPTLLERDGDSYRLAIDTEDDVDLLRFTCALADAERSGRAHDVKSQVAALQRALDAYTSDLLPEEGPADWAVEYRERFRRQAADASATLAELLSDDLGDLVGASSACERGLRIDRYHDGLWRRLISLLERIGDRAKAAYVAQQYDEVLCGLGVAIGQ